MFRRGMRTADDWDDVTRYTVGVEEEYQLVDGATASLESRARAVLDADWSGELRHELQESTIEIGTRVCGSAAELEEELKRLRLQSATAAAAEGLHILAAGLHPTSLWQHHRLARSERYDRMHEAYARIAQDEHNFGMHTHVAVPDGSDAVRLLNAVRHYIPHLLALSCSSPYHEGADTGYASYRMILWRRWPHSGVPPHFRSRAELRSYIDLLLRSGTIDDERNIYWSIRLHPEYPTLEFRMTDVCLRLEDAAAVAALARALVAAADTGLIPEQPWAGTSTDSAHAILAANEWRAARYGLDATLVDPAAPDGRLPLRHAIERLVARIAGTADSLGDGAAVHHILTILERGNGAERMRRTFAEHHRFGPLLEWIGVETMLGTGLDRRTQARVSAIGAPGGSGGAPAGPVFKIQD